MALISVKHCVSFPSTYEVTTDSQGSRKKPCSHHSLAEAKVGISFILQPGRDLDLLQGRRAWTEEHLSSGYTLTVPAPGRSQGDQSSKCYVLKTRSKHQLLHD